MSSNRDDLTYVLLAALNLSVTVAELINGAAVVNSYKRLTDIYFIQHVLITQQIIEGYLAREFEIDVHAALNEHRLALKNRALETDSNIIEFSSKSGAKEYAESIIDEWRAELGKNDEEHKRWGSSIEEALHEKFQDEAMFNEEWDSINSEWQQSGGAGFLLNCEVCRRRIVVNGSFDSDGEFSVDRSSVFRTEGDSDFSELYITPHYVENDLTNRSAVLLIYHNDNSIKCFCSHCWNENSKL